MKDQLSASSHKSEVGGKKPQSLRNVLIARGLKKKHIPTMDKPTMKSKFPSMKFPKVY